MNVVLNQLNKDLTEIRNHIIFIDGLKGDIIPATASHAYLLSNARKKYDYNSLIISLYGILESYLQKFVGSYLETIEDSIFEYEMLSDAFQEYHFQKSLSLISKVSENKYQQFNHLKKELILENLNNCISKFKPYKINREAFFINTGNLKHSKACEIFKMIGVNLESEIRLYDGFKIQSENLFNRQDEIVDRRNEIAHGAVTQIIDNSEIVILIEYLETYFKAIFDLLTDKLENETNIFKKKKFSSLINKATVYKGNIVGIIDGSTLNLKVNSEILIERPSEKTIIGQISNIKLFDKSNDITIKLDKNIRENCKFYIYDKEAYEAAKKT